jgi:protein archease
MTRMPFEEIEHTADWAIRVRGGDLRQLFASAARGMFSLLTDLDPIATTRELELDLHAIDVETLLVDWLNELLYQAEEKEIVFKEFTIRELATHTAHLRATVAGGPAPDLRRTIKAATFSGLALSHDDSGYSMEIVFDV